MKLCMCAQSMVLGTRTKFQLEIFLVVRFLQYTNFERISWRARKTLVKQPPESCSVLLCGHRSERPPRPRDHFVYAPSQWETTLQCNIVSHWLGAYTKWSLQTRLWDYKQPACLLIQLNDHSVSLNIFLLHSECFQEILTLISIKYNFFTLKYCISLRPSDTYLH